MPLLFAIGFLAIYFLALGMLLNWLQSRDRSAQ